MRWHIAKPLDARRLERHVRVEAARHRLVDDRLLLLVQQLDLAALGADEAAEPEIDSIEKMDDCRLLI